MTQRVRPGKTVLASVTLAIILSLSSAGCGATYDSDVSPAARQAADEFVAVMFGSGDVSPTLVDDPLVVDDVLSFRRSIRSAEIVPVDHQGSAVDGCRGLIGPDEKGPCFVYRTADMFDAANQSAPDGRLAVWVVRRDDKFLIAEFVYNVDPHGWPAG